MAFAFENAPHQFEGRRDVPSLRGRPQPARMEIDSPLARIV